MVEHTRRTDDRLDRVFAALADRSRRRMLVQLRKKSLSISELAEPFRMSFAGVAKHVDVLEAAGLIRKIRAPEDGRSFRLQLESEALSDAAEWLKHHQQFWTNQLDRLEAFIEEQDHGSAGRQNRKKN